MTILNLGLVFPAVAQPSAPPGTVVLTSTHKDLDHRLAVPDSTRFLQAPFRYPSDRWIPDPDTRAATQKQRGMLSVPLGIVGATQGALIGYLSQDTFEGSTLDGPAIATGAFLGWSLGAVVGIAADDGAHPAGVLSALWIAGAGLFLVQETDMEGVYFPLAFLQVAAGELLRR